MNDELDPRPADEPDASAGNESTPDETVPTGEAAGDNVAAGEAAGDNVAAGDASLPPPPPADGPMWANAPAATTQQPIIPPGPPTAPPVAPVAAVASDPAGPSTKRLAGIGLATAGVGLAAGTLIGIVGAQLLDHRDDRPRPVSFSTDQNQADPNQQGTNQAPSTGSGTGDGRNGPPDWSAGRPGEGRGDDDDSGWSDDDGYRGGMPGAGFGGQAPGNSGGPSFGGGRGGPDAQSGGS